MPELFQSQEALLEILQSWMRCQYASRPGIGATMRQRASPAKFIEE